MERRNDLIGNLKGLSILAVVGYHVISLFMHSMPNIVKIAANYGSSGVLLFFFASGYGLYCSQYKKKRKYLSFINHRLKKIYIPYVIVVLVSACFPSMYSTNGVIADVLANILQYGTYVPKYFNTLGGHFWYIGTIIQFYLIFPILFYVLNKIGKKKFLILSILITVVYCGGIAAFGLERNQVMIRWFPKYFVEFGSGMVFASYYVEGKDWLKIIASQNKIVLLIIALLGTIITAISSSTALGRLLNDIPAFVGLGLLFILVSELIGTKLKVLLNMVNEISYEIYLVHMLILNIVFNYSEGSFLSECICLTISIILIVFVSVLYRKLLNVSIFKK